MKLISEEKKTKKELFSAIIRTLGIIAEVMFFLPLCVVSCSAQEDEDKAVWGLEAVFGFELSYITDRITGIWWIVFVAIITALIVVLWFVKDKKVFAEFKVKKLILSFLTSFMATINCIILICFIGTVSKRVAAGNEEFVLGTVSVSYTPFFVVLMAIQAVFSVGGFLCVIYLIIKESDQFNELIPECRRLIQKCKEEKVPPLLCTGCGHKLKKNERFCPKCGCEGEVIPKKEKKPKKKKTPKKDKAEQKEIEYIDI